MGKLAKLFGELGHLLAKCGEREPKDFLMKTIDELGPFSYTTNKTSPRHWLREKSLHDVFDFRERYGALLFTSVQPDPAVSMFANGFPKAVFSATRHGPQEQRYLNRSEIPGCR